MTSPIELQRTFWNTWNAPYLETQRGEISRRQSEIVCGWLEEWQLHDGMRGTRPRILEVGCGSGWFAGDLARFGDVVATDLSDDVLARARLKWPHVRFIAGDFLALEFETAPFDIVVSLEVLSHVSDQAGFVRKIAGLLAPGGTLMLATQNGPVLQNYCRIPAPAPGQLRHWVDRTELASLVAPCFEVEDLFSVTPVSQRGYRRLLTSSKLHAMLRPVIGNRLRDALEARDWGWTLMLQAKRRADL
jgi:2-polyprenyl-3-methyl-5-hydroxy-6-metoxy-1,4-benzoquinol methylase